MLSKKANYQNLLLLVANYFFYGFAEWKMLPLLLGATIVYFFLGVGISKVKKESSKSFLSFIGIALGIGLLLYFKYLNFFIESASVFLNKIGLASNLHSLRIIMPLGISFFAFRLISYIVEIHRETFDATHDFISFANYVAFFPCILSGPIDRPSFMNQLKKPRALDVSKAEDGLRQILWGFFKKAVIADNCASYVDAVWGNIAGNNGSTLVVASILYLFEVYADFSGYSDMAIGIGKLLGLKITDNFKFPLFALNIADFWRRWHISLTSWMTDYVFMPLNLKFRTMGSFGIILAIIINMFLVGIWHGANWTYAAYGLYHGLLFVPLILSGAFYRKDKLKVNSFNLPCLRDFGRIMLTWFVVIVGLVIFRAESLSDMVSYWKRMFNSSLFEIPWIMNHEFLFTVSFGILFLLVFEWVQRSKKHAFDISGSKTVVRWSLYLILSLAIIFLGTQSSPYIYFQF